MYIYVCIYIYRCRYSYTHMQAYIIHPIHTYIHAYMHTYMHTQGCVNFCAYMCMCIDLFVQSRSTASKSTFSGAWISNLRCGSQSNCEYGSGCSTHFIPAVRSPTAWNLDFRASLRNCVLAFSGIMQIEMSTKGSLQS